MTLTDTNIFNWSMDLLIACCAFLFLGIMASIVNKKPISDVFVSISIGSLVALILFQIIIQTLN